MSAAEKPLAASPMGSLLPPSEAEGIPVVPSSQRGRTMGARTKRGSYERARVSRFNERAAIYRVLVDRPGQTFTAVDLAAVLGLDRELVVNCMGSMFDHPDDYPDLVRPVRGTIRYEGGGGPSVPAGAPAPPAPPLPPVPPCTAAPAPVPGNWPADEMIVSVVSTRADGTLVVMDEDSGVSYVMRRATPADLRSPT